MIKYIKSIFSDDSEKVEATSVKKSENFGSADKIFEYFTTFTGMQFRKKEKITRDKIINYCRRNNIYDFEELHHAITTSKESMQGLVDYLTVNETFFYREMDQINLLCELAKKHTSKISILCAPCATGEEVYSIVIALLESGVTSSKIEITGIDINSSAITGAKEGVYSGRSLSKLGESIITQYFTKIDDNKYKISNTIKCLTNFLQINIFDKTFKNFGKFDYIFSRNMFIYFDADDRKKAVNIFSKLLKDDNAYMFFGHADTVDETEYLTKRYVGKTKIYYKT